MRAITISTVLLLVLSVIGCEESKPTAPAPTTDELILANVDVFLVALEDYASENGGLYPPDLLVQNAAGNTIFDLLPNGTPLTNPTTGALTEPQAGSAWVPGAIGYVTAHNLGGLVTGYRVDAMGEDGTTIFELIKPAV